MQLPTLRVAADRQGVRRTRLSRAGCRDPGIQSRRVIERSSAESRAVRVCDGSGFYETERMFTLSKTFPFDRVLENFLCDETRRGWMPALDLEETPEAFVLHLEVPGVDPKEIELSIEDDHLKIRGSKNVEERDWRRVERRRGAFERLVRLPGAVDAGRVKAEAKDGVLTVTLPKREEAKTRRIPVKVAG